MSQAQHSIPAGEHRLGIIAKTGNTTHASRASTASAVADKKMRFKLQRKAQHILWNHKAESYRDQFRVCWCHRNLRDIEGKVGVYRKQNGSGARFSNLGTCGSVWHCPVCAAKVSEQRRKELQRAMVAWMRKGLMVDADGRSVLGEDGQLKSTNHAYLLTLTTPHNAEDKLAVILPMFEKTIHTFKNSRTYKNNKKQFEIVGAITSREVTFGNNGWHPHLHMLVFAGHGMEKNKRTIFRMKSAWMRAAKKVGLLHRAKSLKDYRNFWKHALDLRGGAKAAEYIAKFGRDERWGQSSEMTRFHSKVGIRKGAWMDDAHFTPFQILEWATNGDKAASALFKEYAEVYHSKRMITWSRGLADKIGVDKKQPTDEEIAEQEISPMPEEDHIGTLEFEQYRDLLRRNLVGEFIEYVSENCGNPETSQQDIDDYCQSIAQTPETHASVMRKKNGFGKGFSIVGT